MLKPGGMTFHQIGVFTHLDGGHTLNWRSHPPWQHLITETPASVYINRLRLSDYRELFQKYFKQNLRVTLSQSEEALRLLTPEVRKVLHEYSAEELCLGNVEFIATK